MASYQKTQIVLAPKVENDQITLDYRLFSTEGEQIFRKAIDLSGFSEGAREGINSRLYQLLNESLAGYEGGFRSDAWLAVHPVDPANPDAVLHEDRYRSLQKMQGQIGAAIAT